MSRWRDVLRSGFSQGVFPRQLWFLLELPGRRLVQPPAQLAQRLRAPETSRILEIGPGSGFFSVALARGVPAGHLLLIDLEPEFLIRARRKLLNARVSNFTCTAGNATSLPFADHAFDVVVLVSVLGEVTERLTCLREVYRVLKPGGRLSISELRLDPDFIPRGDLETLATRAGFEFADAWGSPRNYTAVFCVPAVAPQVQ